MYRRRRGLIITTMSATDQRMPVFDFYELTTDPDPYPRYEEWRAAGPLIKGGARQWGVTRHAEVAALLKDRRLTHSMPREYTDFMMGPGPSSEFRQNSLLMQDGPGHHRLRHLMAQAFTPQLVRNLQERIETLVDDMIEPLLAGEPYNLAEELAFPLPTAVICELMGIVSADRHQVREHSAKLLGADLEGSDSAVQWMRQYMDGVLATRRADPDGDLLERMLAAGEGSDGFTHQEVVDNAVLLFFAGFETTRHLISSGTVALGRAPEQWGRLRSHPDVPALAVEEFLRFDGPVRAISAMTTEPVEVGDRTIKAGDVLIMLLGCANRDPSAFNRPERLDVGRSPNPHVAFGGGSHRCLGMHLARMEGQVVFRRLSERLRSLELETEPVISSSAFTSYSEVWVKGTPA